MSRHDNASFSGKARLLRTRDRADRHYAEGMITEFLDRVPAGRAERACTAPIGHRAEFHPTVLAAASSDRSQLQLPFNRPAPRSPDPVKRPAKVAPAAATLRAVQPARQRPARDTRFSFSRFVLGGLLGATSATLILFVLAWALA